MAILQKTNCNSINAVNLIFKESVIKNIQLETIIDIENNILPQQSNMIFGELVKFIDTSSILSTFGKVNYLLVDATKGNVTLTLPNIENILFILKRWDNTDNIVVLNCADVNQTIENQESYTMNTKPELALFITSKNNGWYII